MNFQVTDDVGEAQPLDVSHRIGHERKWAWADRSSTGSMHLNVNVSVYPHFTTEMDEEIDKEFYYRTVSLIILSRLHSRYLKPIFENLGRLYIQQSFEEASATLISETAWVSSLSDITRHPKFQEIVDIGQPALRLILEHLNQGEPHLQWFPALKRIAGEDPVPVEARGKVHLMANAWIEWGKQKGLLEP